MHRLRHSFEEERDQSFWPGRHQLQGQRLLQERLARQAVIDDIVRELKLVVVFGQLEFLLDR